MRFIALIGLLLATQTSVAQDSILVSRFVICPVAIEGSGSYFINSTVGQPADQTFANDTLILTQGFQQPDFQQLTAEVEIIWPECDNGNGATVTISNIGGCADDEVTLLWDNVEVDTVLFNVPSGDYDLMIMAGPGCSRFVTVTVGDPPDPCALEFFNTFTPNNDGENDRWIIGAIQFDQFADNHVRIYNRWGRVVWERDAYDNEFVVWDGKSENDQPLPDGTYYYLVEAAGEVFQGFVELMR